MNRSHFKFKYSLHQLLPMVEAKSLHHRNREAHYRQEYEKAEKDLKENGIIMAENAASVASGNVTGFGYSGRGVNPQVDQKLVDVVNKAKDGICKHTQLAVEFERYTITFKLALERDSVADIDLDNDDVEFFGLGKEKA